MGSMGFLTALSLILAFSTALITLGIPEDLQLLNKFDLTVLAFEITAIAGTCVVVTGLPCAVAFVGITIGNIVGLIVVNNELIKLLIFLPVTVILTYVLSKLARSGAT